MSKLIVLSGIPGAGKTTYAQNLTNQKIATKAVSNDEIRFKITKGKFPGQFIWNHLPILRKQLKEVVADLQHNSIVVLDSTMLTNKRRIKCYNRFKKYFDEIELHILEPDLPTSIRQNLMRRRVVPIEQIIKMYNEFEEPNEQVKALYKIFYIK